MSYILEALKKLEQKRLREERGRVAITFQGHAYKGPAKSRLRIYVLCAVLFMTAGFAAWWTGPWREVAPGNKQAPSVAAAVPGSAQDRAGRKAPPIVPAKAIKESPLPLAAKEMSKTSPPPKPPGKRAPEARQASAEGGEAFSDAFPRAEPKPPPGGRILKLTDLPASVASALPQLRMSLHYYIAEPRSRFARIDDTTLREGQFLSEGLKLDEVTESGAVMNFKGWRFVIPIATP
jgi:general secretion pathway protein B